MNENLLAALAISSDYRDRVRAAQQNYKLDKLVNDENTYVRAAVARQGYGLDILINDTSLYVVQEVKDYLVQHNYKSIFDWAKDNNVSIPVDEWLNSDDYFKRCILAEEGYRLDKFISDKDSSVRLTALQYLREHGYRSIFDWAADNNIDLNIDEWLNSGDENKQFEVVKKGYGLDILKNSPNSDICKEIAKQGYGLEIFIADYDDAVRRTAEIYLINHNYKSVFDWAIDNNVNIDLDEWLNSNDIYKRLQVVKYGYSLNILINDKEALVREEVAKHGYRLDILICDKENIVRHAAYEYLREHKYRSVIDWAKEKYVDINLDEWLESEDYDKLYSLAKYGYRLDVLIDNPDIIILCEIDNYLKDHNYNSLSDWAKDNNIEMNIDLEEWSKSNLWLKRRECAYLGYNLEELFHDINIHVREAANIYLENHNMSIYTYCNKKANICIDKFKEFIYNIADSNKLMIKTYDSIDEFFSSEKDFDKQYIEIVTIEDKIPIISIAKTDINFIISYKFSLNIENHNIKLVFDSDNQFEQLMSLVIDELNEDSRYYKYAEELEKCL